MDLKEARAQKNMSQVELARAVGVTPVMVSRYENRHSLPQPSTRRRIEKILGPVDWPQQIRHLPALRLGERRQQHA